VISFERLEKQLKRINFHYNGWGRTEVAELCNILMPEEEIEECVNGWYEAGFALLVATKDRVLLVDKKPLGYLTVEDMRFDMINELDLHHRLMGAQIRISAGNKTLYFTSLNQGRLRRLLQYVQARMVQIKRDQNAHQDAQKAHLEEMNEQLRLYLMAMHKQQFVDRAQEIREGEIVPQPSAYIPAQPGILPVVEQPEPATPFEKAAAQAFDAHLHPGQESSSAPAQTPAPESSTAQGPSHAPSLESPAAHQLVPQWITSPQQVTLAAARRVLPVVGAYTRLPLSSQRRHTQFPSPSQGEPVSS
jgi:hypothetical protein